MADSRLNDHPATADDAEPGKALEVAPQQMVYRRAPKITPFLVTGAVLGVVAAFFWIATVGATEDYSLGQTASFFAALFAVVGLTVGAVWWMIVDRRSKRKVSTVYARRTDDPAAADVALTQDDYSEWSQFQQQEHIETARREQHAQAKAQAKAEKRNKR